MNSSINMYWQPPIQPWRKSCTALSAEKPRISAMYCSISLFCSCLSWPISCEVSVNLFTIRSLEWNMSYSSSFTCIASISLSNIYDLKGVIKFKWLCNTHLCLIMYEINSYIARCWGGWNDDEGDDTEMRWLKLEILVHALCINFSVFFVF